jgi:signal transduction histidine kinase
MCTVVEGRDERVIDFRDVTAAKELEEAKDLFLATTSHELRTPITVVQGFASTLANRWDKLVDSDRRSAVRTIAERAESLGRLVDQLLLGSRVGANRLAVSDEPFDLAKLVTAAATVFRPLSERHVLETELPDGLPMAQGDAGATDSIIGQLLENAFKYSPDGGVVTIAARAVAEDRLIEVTVRDHGIGIAPADTERVFERFVQGDAGDRRRFGGIGLGLYIVRQLARAQGGDITATPAPDRGTIMRLALRQAVAVTQEEGTREDSISAAVDTPAAAAEDGRASAAKNDGAAQGDKASAAGADAAASRRGEDDRVPAVAGSRGPANGRRVPPMLSRLPRPRMPSDDRTRRRD